MSTLRFQIPQLVTPADPDSTTAQLQASYDYIQDALNTLADEAALEREILHGVGRLDAAGCTIGKGDDGVLRLANGYFLAGPGVPDTDAEYFVGARLVRVNGEAGYIELTGEDAPPMGKAAGTYGYMSAYGDVLWDDTKPPTVFDKNGRWCIGKVVTGAAAIESADASVADIVPSLMGLQARVVSLETRVTNLETNGGGGGGGGGSFTYVGTAPYLPDPGDDRALDSVLTDKLNTLEARLRQEIQNGGRRPRQTVVDQLMHELALVRQMVIRLGTLSPVTTDDAERSQSANVVGRADGSIYGDGSGDHPDHITTNLTINADGSLEP